VNAGASDAGLDAPPTIAAALEGVVVVAHELDRGFRRRVAVEDPVGIRRGDIAAVGFDGDGRHHMARIRTRPRLLDLAPAQPTDLDISAARAGGAGHEPIRFFGEVLDVLVGISAHVGEVRDAGDGVADREFVGDAGVGDGHGSPLLGSVIG